MPQLRWTLLILGVLFVILLAWIERRRQHRGFTDHGPMESDSAGGPEPSAPLFREPTLTLPEMRARDPITPHELPVVDIEDDSLQTRRTEAPALATLAPGLSLPVLESGPLKRERGRKIELAPDASTEDNSDDERAFNEAVFGPVLVGVSAKDLDLGAPDDVGVNLASDDVVLAAAKAVKARDAIDRANATVTLNDADAFEAARAAAVGLNTLPPAVVAAASNPAPAPARAPADVAVVARATDPGVLAASPDPRPPVYDSEPPAPDPEPPARDPQSTARDTEPPTAPFFTPADVTPVKEPIVDWPEDDQRKVIALRLVAAPSDRLAGRAVRLALSSEGFVLGKFQIFHKPDGSGRAVLSAANLSKPGTFDTETMDSQRFGGLSLFAVLPGPKPPLKAFEDLLATARNLNERLQGALQDERGGPLTPTRIAALRDSLDTEVEP